MTSESKGIQSTTLSLVLCTYNMPVQCECLPHGAGMRGGCANYYTTTLRNCTSKYTIIHEMSFEDSKIMLVTTE